MRIIGIDPGLRNMGWGVIEQNGHKSRHIANGICRSKGSDLAGRLLSLHQQLSDVLAEYQPKAAAVEQTFVNSDGAGTLKLGQARGIAMLVPAQFGCEVAEYAPNSVKKSVVGAGHANKDQVLYMVSLQLSKPEIAGPDAADALAIALCHAQHAGSGYQAAVARAVGA